VSNHIVESLEVPLRANFNPQSIPADDSRIKVLIVDDHPVVRVGLRTMLESEGNIEVSGTAESAQDAVMEVQRNKPHVVLMDLRMPEVDGTRAILELRRTWPDLRILVLTNYQADEDILCALQAGAMGYLLKNSPQEEIVQAIKMVYESVHYVPADIEERLLHMISRDKLSERELEVLTLVAKGKSNKEIAKQLFISDKTARNHVASCLVKLACGSRTEAVTTALRRGLIRLSE
jgi:DNA-binding NarL/FixJ family response regulator